MKGSTFLVHVLGTESLVVEVAEQLAWLGAALATSPFERGIAICTPRISWTSSLNSSGTNEGGHGSGNQVENPITEARFDLSFHFDQLDATDSNGQCWQKLFLNPVLVRGYPINRRPIGVKGLELSLDVMATLLQASRVTRFGATPFIKGFSALAVLTQKAKDVILWHLVVNEDINERISYNDSRIPRSQNIEQVEDVALQNSRHILGWCSHVKSLTGKIFLLIRSSMACFSFLILIFFKYAFLSDFYLAYYIYPPRNFFLSVYVFENSFQHVPLSYVCYFDTFSLVMCFFLSKCFHSKSVLSLHVMTCLSSCYFFPFLFLLSISPVLIFFLSLYLLFFNICSLWICRLP